MKVKVKSQSPSQRVVEVTLDEARVEEAYRQAFKEKRKQLRVKGFRKGNVPNKIAKKYLTDAHLVKRVVNLLVPPAYKEALKQEKLTPLGKPDWTLLQSDRGKELIFEATLQVMPLLDIDEYKNFPVEAAPVAVDEEQVEQVLYQRRQSAAVYASLPPEHQAESGDFAFIDYHANHNGKPLPQAAVKNFLLEMKPEKFLPGFVESLLGVKAGEQRTFDLTLPLSYAERTLAGEKVEFVVKVHQLKRREVPELDDAFAKKYTKSESLQNLRDNVRKNLESQQARRREEEITNQIVRTLVSNIDPSDVPMQLQEGHARLALRTQTQNLERQGLAVEEYLKQRGISTQHFEEELRLTGLVEARLEILYRSIAAAEKIVVLKKEVDQAIINQAQASGTSAKALKTRMLEEDTYKLLAYRLLIGKVRKALFENADIVEPQPESKKSSKKAAAKKKTKSKKAAKKKNKAKAKSKKAAQKKTKTKTKPKTKSKSKTKTKPQKKATSKKKSKAKSKSKKSKSKSKKSK